MLKGILLTVILLACGGIGRLSSNLRKRRYEILGELLAGLRVLRLRMLNSLDPVGILLRKSDCQLFCELGNSLGSGICLSEAWHELRASYTRQNGKLSMMHEDDLRILDDFFLSLGRSGRDEQNEMFSGVIDRMEAAQAHARHSYMDASKLYTALGAFIGIAICILII